MSGIRKERGAALLVLAVILVVGVSAFLVSTLNKLPDQTTLNRNHNARVLQQAKDALIGFVAKEVLNLAEDIPGRFPCPEVPGDAGGADEGTRGGFCAPGFSSAKTVGRLPWRTLGLDKLVDAAGEPLWYVVSPNWVLNGGTPPKINSGTAGQLSVDGIGNVVAIIIAPGRPLSINPTPSQVAAGCTARQQLRADKSHVGTTAPNPDYRDYLECQNGSDPVDLAFTSSVADNEANPVFNDQLVYITAEELLNAIQGPVAERTQRTVAPLLSEFSETWPGANFLPYAAAFRTPEDNLAVDSHCGPSASTPQQTEGLLPIAPSAGNCNSAWAGASVSGLGITPTGSPSGCTPGAAELVCTFRYYRITALGAILALLGGGTTTLTASVQAVAPHATASFRGPLQTADVTIDLPEASTVQANAVSLTPKTDGDAQLSLEVRVNGTNLCRDDLLGSLPLVGPVTCFLLFDVLGLAEAHDVTVRVPNLGSPVLQGTKLSAGVLKGHSPPYNFSLLAPVAGDPHYWFIANEWYRYTYYAIAPSATVEAAAGNLTVNGFPPANGNANDKRFVLAVMGPAVTGQARSPAAALSQYLEGENALAGASPRTFAYQVYAASGNDRIATCPFDDGAKPCN